MKMQKAGRGCLEQEMLPTADMGWPLEMVDGDVAHEAHEAIVAGSVVFSTKCGQRQPMAAERLHG
jgi:hypothetical protein